MNTSTASASFPINFVAVVPFGKLASVPTFYVWTDSLKSAARMGRRVLNDDFAVFTVCFNGEVLSVNGESDLSE